jgi:hypothetical protein
VDNAVVDIHVPCVVRQHDRRAMASHRGLDLFDDVQQLDGIQAVVWEIQRVYRGDAENISSRLGGLSTLHQALPLRARSRLGAPGGLTVGNQQQVHRAAVRGQARNRAAASEHLIVRMRGYNQDAAT